MKREWEPGDVALASYDGEVKTYLYGHEFNTDRFRWVSTDGSTSVDFHMAEWWRPIVVIDPEDREQVERLVKALSTGQPLIGLDPTNREMVDQAWVTHTQTALREFANPTPLKPEEPMGLGAVVATEADGDYIRVRIGPGNPWLQLNPWLNVRTGAHYHWDRVAAVRVLSEGVTA